MLKDTNYTAELDALRRNTHDAGGSDMSAGGSSYSEHHEEDIQVSTSEALDMIREVRPTTQPCSPHCSSHTASLAIHVALEHLLRVVGGLVAKMPHCQPDVLHELLHLWSDLFPR